MDLSLSVTQKPVPIGDKVYVKVNPVGEGDSVMTGLVVNTGTGVYQHGVKLPMTVHPGQRIAFPLDSGPDIEINKEHYRIMREDQVLFIY